LRFLILEGGPFLRFYLKFWPAKGFSVGSMKLSLIIPVALPILGTIAAPANDVEEIERRALNCAVVSSVVNYFTKYTSAASSL
jgi:hypothetical protein